MLNFLLTEFKERMHIFHSSEDANLLRILDASVKDINSLGGDMVKEPERTIELVLERSRYVYNDSLEFFNDNFREQLMNLSLDCYDIATEEVDVIE